VDCRELMTKDPISVSPSATVQDVMDLMMDKDIRHVPIVENGELIGMISDRDLRQISWTAVVEGGPARLTVPVSSLMSGDPISVDQEADATEVIDIMIDQKIGAVPVVDETENRLVGIVSYMDVLKHARDAL
jgi:CBS domain-containing protein